MPRLQISCLGTLSITLDGRSITDDFDTNQTRALLIYLVIEASRPHPREYLAGILWPDQPDQRALHNLRQRLAYLRKILGDDTAAVPFLLVTRNTVQWNSESDYWLDIQVFTQSLSAAYRHYQHRNGKGWLKIRQLKQALQVYQGQFLDLFYLSGSDLFLEWVTLQREDSNRQAVEGLALLADYYERRGEYALARQAVARVIELAPWEETAQSQMMRLLAMDQQWSAAQNQYAILRRYLRDQLNVEPSQATVSLFNEIRAAAAHNSAIPARLLRSQHNLPDPPTSFIGRVEDLNFLSERLSDPECRLLTLLGPGGIGKTRLAMESAREQVGIPADGVFFIPLVQINTSKLILSAIADGLGMSVSDRFDLETLLLNYLRNKHLILVLDNFEHLLAAQDSIDLLSKILQEAPGVRLVVTSRERLSLQEECIYLLNGMSYPSNGDLGNAAPESFDSLALFTRRARQLRGNFALDANTLPAAIRICQLFDGLPLGVELAAAACWDCTCDEIFDRITRDFDELTASASNITPRHRSLSAAIDVSWQLLTPVQRIVLCQLSVFRGGFDTAAAQAVAGIELGPTGLVPLLSVLVDKSLLRRSTSGRYDLHEVIRQYAADKLANIAEGAASVLARHARYYADFLANLNGNLKNASQAIALDAVHREIENARTAWGWLSENHCADEISRCADSLYQYFNVRSRFSEGIELFQQAVQGLDHHDLGKFGLGVSLSRLGALAYRARENTLAHGALLHSLEIFNRMDVPSELALCMISLSGLQLRQKEFETALAYAHSSLGLYRRLTDQWGESYALYLLGLIKIRMGQFDEAWPVLVESVEVSRRMGGHQRLIAPLNLLGDVACFKGDYESAEKYFQESLDISRTLSDRYNQAIVLNNLATVYQSKQQYDQEIAVFNASLALCREIGDRDGEATALNGLGEMAVHLGEYEQAVRYSQEAMQIAQQVGEMWTIIVCLNNLGEAYCNLGETSKAEIYVRQALRAAFEIQALDLLTRTTVTLGRVYQKCGEINRAVRLIQAALANSALDDEPRVKARRWLTEMGMSVEVKNRDAALGEVVTNELLV
jgi:predicted ATPase/DNA-binding SARP family transcriptional activator